jgi:hypothetical protein
VVAAEDCAEAVQQIHLEVIVNGKENA